MSFFFLFFFATEYDVINLGTNVCQKKKNFFTLYFNELCFEINLQLQCIMGCTISDMIQVQYQVRHLIRCHGALCIDPYHHILDHVMSCLDDNLEIECKVTETPITWHDMITFTLNLPKPPLLRIASTVKNYRSIDSEHFHAALQEHLNPVPEMTCPNDLLSWYDTTVSKTLDVFAPKVTRTRCVRPRMQ